LIVSNSDEQDQIYKHYNIENECAAPSIVADNKIVVLAYQKNNNLEYIVGNINYDNWSENPFAGKRGQCYAKGKTPSISMRGDTIVGVHKTLSNELHSFIGKLKSDGSIVFFDNSIKYTDFQGDNPSVAILGDEVFAVFDYENNIYYTEGKIENDIINWKFLKKSEDLSNPNIIAKGIQASIGIICNKLFLVYKSEKNDFLYCKYKFLNEENKLVWSEEKKYSKGLNPSLTKNSTEFLETHEATNQNAFCSVRLSQDMPVVLQ
jgi:hypothetical protein